jgi:hypothetical protein
MSANELNYREILGEIERAGGVPSDKPFFTRVEQAHPYQVESDQRKEKD